MARLAVGWRTDILETIMSLMTGFAIGCGVRTGQGETPFGVLHEQFLARLPVARCVTFGAIGAELPLVMIGVAIETCGPDMAEDRIFMASGTINLLVGPDKIESRLGMVEFHVRAHTFPGFRSMAIVAVPDNFTVRILSRRRRAFSGKKRHG